VNGYPTIKFFGSNKEKPEDYNGGRGEDDIVSFATAKWQDQLPPPQVGSTSPADRSLHQPAALIALFLWPQPLRTMRQPSLFGHHADRHMACKSQASQ